jgi:EpsD family peptidyl-prolyl cis-trans isomerase
MKLTKQQLPGLSGLRLAAIAAASVAVLLVGCGDGKKSEKASQTAAKVNKEEITVHQINFVLQRQQGLKPEQTEAASKQVLERLIDQEVVVQKAQDLKLDRDPRVVQQIEAAKREIIARAYADRIGEAATKPTSEEVAKYYSDNPALFSDRHIYNLQEVNVEAKPDQVPAIRASLEKVKNAAEFIEFLKSGDYHFNGNQAVRSAEQLPLAALRTIAKMKDGDSVANVTPAGLQILFLAGSRSQPINEVQAKPAIEQFLTNQRKGELVQKDVKALREAAKIEYIGKFAEKASDAASAAAPLAAPASDAGAASGAMDANTIAKGMRLK